jgi:DNA-binding transcriptional LysR family regulator
VNIVPLLGEFLHRYPDVLPDLHFDNRQVDIVAAGFDVAIGGGIELTDALIARELARLRIVLVAAPAYLKAHPAPSTRRIWRATTACCAALWPPGA